ncbi:2-amino-4-hydroxy-6-hydroxymethyldihydropteridine diphosphokinase [Luteimonas sp. R10]|uniref:2-amino-4-hydroxy-6- hydroxymethyldihydropteridine diphosphokinase n=1 Tax=Luteimonas sp. R10 TaxID=3108176 RepID=UPI0030908BEA|nr:2-amino-4-hydroxy-6-hydroxymethyldihydropteridine diphosphokinase [Luteimonas sp. R10]
MGRACLSLGGNLEPERHLAAAIGALRARFPGAVVSRVYRTRAVGFDGADFLNAAAVIDSDLDAYALDAWLHALEDAHGRDRSGPRFGDRTLDLDLVLYDDLVLEGPDPLRLPRPELRHAFVLRPLAEIAPEVVEPASGRTLAELWAESPERDTPMAPVALAGMA